MIIPWHYSLGCHVCFYPVDVAHCVKMLALLWFPSLYSLYWYCINRLSTGTEIWTNQLKSWIYCSIRCCVFLHHLHLLFSYSLSCSTFHGTSLCRLGKSSRTWTGKTEGEDDTRTPHFPVLSFHFILFHFISFSIMLALFCFLLFCFIFVYLSFLFLCFLSVLFITYPFYLSWSSCPINSSCRHRRSCRLPSVKIETLLVLESSCGITRDWDLYHCVN